MAWHITDFDNVRFNQSDNGWLTVFGIHRAIKERAEATQHSLMADYTGDFDLPVWLGDPDSDTDRVYLKDVLEQFYTDIDRLIDGDSEIRWTEASGAGALWTIASINADIGMGDFSDLLTRAANPEMFMWLQGALDRLIHARVRITATVGIGSLVYTNSGFPNGGTLQSAWDDRADTTRTDVFPNGSIQIFWDIQARLSPFFDYMAIVRSSMTGREYKTSLYSGVLVESYYNYVSWWANTFTPSSMDYVVGTNTLTMSAAGTGSELTTDFALGADTYIDAYIDTAEPSTVPFSGDPTGSNGTGITISSVDLHIDLATVLTDQA